MLFCRINDKSPGQTLQLESGTSVHITAEVWTQLPLDRLELIANGEVIGAVRLSPGQQYAEINLQYTPKESVWLAARAHQFTQTDSRQGVSFAQRRGEGGGPTKFNEYFGTLRPETAFAHTNPVYLIVDNHPVCSPEDAAFYPLFK